MSTAAPPSDAARSNDAFDDALIAGVFRLAGREGWGAVSVAEAAREAGLPLARARARFPDRTAVLMRFGRRADQAALAEPATEPQARDRLFDLLMRRFDAMQEHREGITALMRGLPADPGAAALLYAATLRSMAWMLEGAGISSRGLRGMARTHGLLGVWLYAMRAWERDDSPDLSGTMAALDKALGRAEQAADWLQGGYRASADPAVPAAGSEAGAAAPAAGTAPPTGGSAAADETFAGSDEIFGTGGGGGLGGAGGVSATASVSPGVVPPPDTALTTSAGGTAGAPSAAGPASPPAAGTEQGA